MSRPEMKVAWANVIAFNLTMPNVVLVTKSKSGNRVVLPGSMIGDSSAGSLEERWKWAANTIETDLGRALVRDSEIGKAIHRDGMGQLMDIEELESALPGSAGSVQLRNVHPRKSKVISIRSASTYLFLGHYDHFNYFSSEFEITGIRQFDIFREPITPREFDDDHDVFLLWYLWMLRRGTRNVPSDALKNLSKDRGKLHELLHYPTSRAL